MTENKITDSFGRIHNYLRISLTERCNLRCFYCMPADGIDLTPKQHLMTAEEVISLAGTFVNLGVKKIRLTGGEPLVRKDADKIIRGLARYPVELAITTNGILVDKYLDLFKETGIMTINVSLDSLQKEKMKQITRRDYHKRIMDNINLLIKKGFEVKVNCVLIRGVNDDELINFIQWTKEMPVHVRFIEFMPFDGNRWNWEKGVSFRDIMKNVHMTYPLPSVIRISDRQNDTAKNYRIKGHKGTFAIISSVTNPFCDTCNRIRLTADGKIRNCLFSNQETDLLKALRAGDDVVSLIQSTIINKKAMRAGMNTFDKLSDPTRNQNNRSMVMIGG